MSTVLMDTEKIFETSDTSSMLTRLMDHKTLLLFSPELISLDGPYVKSNVNPSEHIASNAGLGDCFCLASASQKKLALSISPSSLRPSQLHTALACSYAKTPRVNLLFL
jgi:hypothetical protein